MERKPGKGSPRPGAVEFYRPAFRGLPALTSGRALLRPIPQLCLVCPVFCPR